MAAGRTMITMTAMTTRTKIKKPFQRGLREKRGLLL